jgi:anti-anti-sigma factor
LKVSLRQIEGYSILDIQGDIDVHNFAVLKAGLTKLFRNGKNRIVVHIENGESISSDVIREIAILDVFARELSGKIVIASASETLKSNVVSFAKPPVVGILPDVSKAVGYLKDLDALEGEEGGESLAELNAKLEAKDKQIAALEAQIKQASGAEVQGLRAENAKLKDQVGLLEAQVAEYASRKKEPFAESGYREKVEALEETVRRLGGEKVKAGAKA